MASAATAAATAAGPNPAGGKQPPAPVAGAAAKKFVPPPGTPAAFEHVLRTVATDPDGILRLAIGDNSLPTVRGAALVDLLAWQSAAPPPWAATHTGAFGLFDDLLTRTDPRADALVAELGPATHTRVPVPGLAADTGVQDPGHSSSMPSLTPEYLAEKLGVTELPSWVDPAQILRGQEFFWKYAFLIFAVLLHGSLAGSFGIPRVDSVLMYTGYLTSPSKSTARRLMETTEMILNAFVPGELLKVGGAGWMHVCKVRLMHAGVRARIAKALAADPASISDRAKAVKSSSDAALPINQADMAVTALSFQTAVLTGLLKLGVVFTWQEMVDYTAVWRFIAHLIGVDDDANPCQWGVQTSFYLAAVYLSKYSVVYRLSDPALAHTVAVGGACPFAGGAAAGETTDVAEAAVAETAAAEAAAAVAAAATTTAPATQPPAHIAQAGELTHNVLESTARHVTRQAPWLHAYFFHRLVGPTLSQRLRVDPPSKTQGMLMAMLMPSIRLEADLSVRLPAAPGSAKRAAASAAANGGLAPAPWVMPRVRFVKKFIASIEKRLDKDRKKAAAAAAASS
ncbi:hypothetical protein HK405_005268 [Cladochytrium tenue]|nr:hypothetical protein HK405_005268 [Cladochytrium tenue]